MQNLTIEKIRKYSGAELLQGDPEKIINNIVIDSREVKAGSLFIAIIGENQDGHSYINDAVDNGAAAVIVDRDLKLDRDLSVLKVNDTTRALQDIAHKYRKQFPDLKVVAVTGSAGKTTTKDMIHSLLAQKYNCLKTSGNYNNHIGLPLTLLDLSGKEDFAVLEMGMSGFGEIKLLAEIAEADYGVVTNVGAAHLKQLGSLENIANAKKELIDSLNKNNTAVLNYDNQYTKKMGENCSAKVIYYGFDSSADLKTINFNFDKKNSILDFEINYKNQSYNFYLDKPGKHNIYNAMAAAVVALENDLKEEEIQKGLLNLEFSSLRMEIKELGNGSKIINDSYNANPLAVKAALDVLIEMEGSRKIAVLASMLELGKQSKSAHQEIGNYAAQNGVDLLITVGDKAAMIAQGAESKLGADNIISIKNNKGCIEYLAENLRKNDLVLVKGSRANKLEEIVEALINKELKN